MVIFGAVLLKIPRFFHFQLNEEGSDYATSPLMENTAYIWANAYWDDLMITGFIPLLILIYFNLRIYLRVSYHKIRSISALSISTVIYRYIFCIINYFYNQIPLLIYSKISDISFTWVLLVMKAMFYISHFQSCFQQKFLVYPLIGFPHILMLREIKHSAL